MAYTKGSIQPGSAKARILELLADKPQGLHSRTIALTLDLREQAAANACFELGKFGMVCGVLDSCGAGKRTRQKRWCLPEHKATTQAICNTQPARATVWTKAGMGRVTQRETWAKGEPKHTVCPSTEDTRYTVKNPTPFFSAMTPGSYLTTGSAIERAYGGGE